MAVALGARRRVRIGPALRIVPLPVAGLVASALIHAALIVAIVFAVRAIKEHHQDAYYVNLVPAVAAVGSPQGTTSAPVPSVPRAPDVPAFFDGQPPAYVEALLDPASLRRTGIFDPPAVAALVRRCRAGLVNRVWENQALVAILSTELWYREFLVAPVQEEAAPREPVRTPAAVAPPVAA